MHSSTITIATDGEHLTYSGFSLSKTIHFGSLEFIIDCFGSLSFSTRRSDSGAIFVGMARNGLPSLRTILMDSTDKFYMASSREGGAPTSLSLAGIAWGHRLLPSQPHHGWRMLCPLRPW
jgi:hypothetical protein